MLVHTKLNCASNFYVSKEKKGWMTACYCTVYSSLALTYTEDPLVYKYINLFLKTDFFGQQKRGKNIKIRKQKK